MADFDFENPTFDSDGHGVDNDKSFDLPDAIMEPFPLRVQQELNTSGDIIQRLQGELREVELQAHKKRLFNTFYKEVTQVYGLRPDSIDYDQFRIDVDGKTLYWTPGDKKDIDYYYEGRSPGVTNIGLEVWGRMKQMHCGDRWDSPVTHRGHRGKV